MLKQRSAIADQLRHGGRDGAAGHRLMRIGERRGWELIQIASFTTTSVELQEIARPLVATDLPYRVGEALICRGRRLLKSGPEQWWIVAHESDDLKFHLQDAIAPNIGTVNALASSRPCFFIDGSAVREVLAKGIAVNLDPAVFRLNHFALTGLHHTPILLYRSGESRYDIYPMRSFALSVWNWLTDAALMFGYDVFVETADSAKT